MVNYRRKTAAVNVNFCLQFWPSVKALSVLNYSKFTLQICLWPSVNRPLLRSPTVGLWGNSVLLRGPFRYPHRSGFHLTDLLAQVYSSNRYNSSKNIPRENVFFFFFCFLVFAGITGEIQCFFAHYTFTWQKTLYKPYSQKSLSYFE